MEEQAQLVIQHLRRTNVAIDAKLAKFSELKSNIKHQRVPEAAQSTIFECIKLAIGSQTSSSLVSSGFSALGHLIKRLTLQNQTSTIRTEAGKLFPVILDRFGDARESHRNAASTTLAELWQHCDKDVERVVRDTALVGTNARAKEMAMHWTLKMSKSGLQFKTFVPKLVANLEDPDGAVRDVAKHSVVELFKDAPEHAKADLKKQMVKYQVRSSISSHIIAQLGIPGEHSVADLQESTTASVASRSTTAHSVTSHAHSQAESMFAESQSSETTAPAETVEMDPLYLHTQRELEDVFRDLSPHFEGKESEGNWIARDKGVLKLRRILKGNAPSDFLQIFLTSIKGLLDGILKVANSLRTTMSTNGCHLVQELAQTLGPAMDNMVEILLQNFIKMSAATKKIAAANANQTVDVLFQNVSFNNRSLQHVWLACQDKNVQPREYAAGWLKTLIKKHAPHRSLFEHGGGLEIVEKCLKKGVQDPNPKVRENMRSTYRVFAPVWPDRAEALKETLEKKHRDALDRDSRQPTAVDSSKSNFSKSLGTSASRPNMRELIAQQRKAALAAKQERPTSAHSVPSPAKQPSVSNLQTRAPSALSNSRTARPGSSASTARPSSRAANVATTPASSSNGGSGLMSAAPIRRPRPKLEAARPATADPYAANRRMKDTATPGGSPANTPQRETTVKKSVNAKSTVRPKTPSSLHRDSPSTSPSKVKAKVDSGLRRKTPTIDSPRQNVPSPGSPSKTNEELTMVLPFGKKPAIGEQTDPKKRMDKPKSLDAGIPHLDDDDNFTLVRPDMMNRAASSALADDLPKLQNRQRTVASPPRSSRRRSPERFLDGSHKEHEEVQVYEDPFVGENATTPSDTGRDKPVLEELQLNKANIDRRADEEGDVSMTMMGDGANGLPRGKSAEEERTDALRSKRLLISGIERIRSRNLDAHGFRRLQELVKTQQDIFSEGKFSDLLVALLEYLEAPIEESKLPPTKVQNLKTQALATIRALLTLHKVDARPHHPRALKSLLRARMSFDATSHIASELERTAEEIVRTNLSSPILDALLDLTDVISTSTGGAPSPFEAENMTSMLQISPSETPSRAITAALALLSQTLHLASQPVRPRSPTKSPSKSHSKQPRFTLSPTQVQRLGRTAVRFLADSEPDVRKADLEFCVAIRDWTAQMSGEEGVEREKAFWKVLGVGEGAMEIRKESLNLITYYLAKRGAVGS